MIATSKSFDKQQKYLDLVSPNSSHFESLLKFKQRAMCIYQIMHKIQIISPHTHSLQTEFAEYGKVEIPFGLHTHCEMHVY